MILSTHGIVGSQILQASGLLIDYPGAAAAYSLRLLRTNYVGSAIRVRRASDNAEQDIGFVSNVLNTAALLSFCSGTNGFVKTWYDQSGNGYDATQLTAANQPQIVSSGSVLTRNAKPILQSNGSSFMTNSTFPLYGNIGSTFVTIYLSATRAARAMMSGAGDQYWPMRTATGTDRLYNTDANLTASALPTGLNLISIIQNTTTKIGNAFENSIQIATNYTTSANTLGGSTTLFGRFGGSSLLLNEHGLSEIIIYPLNQSSNRTGIETNINTYYGIY